MLWVVLGLLHLASAGELTPEAARPRSLGRLLSTAGVASRSVEKLVSCLRGGGNDTRRVCPVAGDAPMTAGPDNGQQRRAAAAAASAAPRAIACLPHSGLCACGRPASIGVEGANSTWARVLCRTCGKAERRGNTGLRTHALGARCRACVRLAVYAPPGEGRTGARKRGSARAVHCGAHRQAGEVNVVTPLCGKANCSRVAIFGVKFKGSGRNATKGQLFCRAHRRQGDRKVVNVAQQCRHTGCEKHATFGVLGGKAAMYCRDHKVQHARSRAPQCQEEGCRKQAICGPAPKNATAHERSKLVTCLDHRLPGHMVLRRRMCAHPEGCLRPALPHTLTLWDASRCQRHQPPPEHARPNGSDARTHAPTSYCAFRDWGGNPVCARYAPYLDGDGSGLRYCPEHRSLRDVRVAGTLCEAHLCGRQPTFGPGETGSPPQRCARHRLPGDRDVRNPLCRAGGCATRAMWGPAAGAMTHCKEHAAEGDVLLGVRLCRGVGVGGKVCGSRATHAEGWRRRPEYCSKCAAPYMRRSTLLASDIAKRNRKKEERAGVQEVRDDAMWG